MGLFRFIDRPRLESGVSVSPRASRLRITRQLERAHFENWVTRHGIRQWKIIIEGQSRKWSRDIIFLNRKQCRLANGTRRP